MKIEKKNFIFKHFHSSTYPNDLYGSSTINNNQIKFNCGPLTRALIEGKYYIADELNISPMSTILSIVPILDLIFDTRLFIPGIYNLLSKIKSKIRTIESIVDIGEIFHSSAI